MSRWHRNHPEQYEEFGEPDWLGNADMERKRQKEEGGRCEFCRGAGHVGNAARWFSKDEPPLAACPRCGGTGKA